MDSIPISIFPNKCILNCVVGVTEGEYIREDFHRHSIVIFILPLGNSLSVKCLNCWTSRDWRRNDFGMQLHYFVTARSSEGQYLWHFVSSRRTLIAPYELPEVVRSVSLFSPNEHGFWAIFVCKWIIVFLLLVWHWVWVFLLSADHFSDNSSLSTFAFTAFVWETDFSFLDPLRDNILAMFRARLTQACYKIPWPHSCLRGVISYAIRIPGLSGYQLLPCCRHRYRFRSGQPKKDRMPNGKKGN